MSRSYQFHTCDVFTSRRFGGNPAGPVWSAESPVLSYESVDVSLVEPRKRDYSKGKTKSA